MTVWSRAAHHGVLLHCSCTCALLTYFCALLAQGAAFDVPQEIADRMMENVEELTKRGFQLDMPTSLPEEPVRGGGGGGGRSGRGG